MDPYVDFDIKITEFISARRKEHKHTWAYETKNRTCTSIVLFYKGTVDYKDKETSFKILPNSVVWLPKGSSYTITSVGDEDVGFIALTFLVDGGELPFRMLRIPQNNKDIASMFDDALGLSLSRDIAYNLAIKGRIYEILFALLRLHALDPGMQSVGYEGIFKSVSYIHKHLDEKISLARLAQLSGYSQSYYRRRFQAEYGMSPIYYINLQRVEKAKKLLLGGFYTKSEVASLCGFENQQFFTKVFKKYAGKTPSEFCKSFDIQSECEL